MLDIEKIKAKKTVKELLEFGIINIDKPSGPTSFDVSDFVRETLSKVTEARKTSHFGTLDPKVTGVLPVALNRACKLTGFFLGEDKEYTGIMRIHGEIDIKKLQTVINKKFTGKILQKPPVKSRVKRVEREREIKSFEVLEKSDEENDFLFRATVQGGTYIRKLIDDLGKEIGIGAHMLELRRVRAGIFKEDDAVYPSITLYDFEKAVEEYKKGNETDLRGMIIPGETITELYSVVYTKEEAVKKLFNGSPLFAEDIEKKEGDYKVGNRTCVFSGEKFIGVYSIVKSGNVFAKPEFVLQPI